jgi:hypothetical protein
MAVTELDLYLPAATKVKVTSALVPICTEAIEAGAVSVGAAGVGSSLQLCIVSSENAATKNAKYENNFLMDLIFV